MKFESLIFDIDGTLWDSRELVAEGYNAQLRAEGLEHLCTDAQRLAQLFGRNAEGMADGLFSDVPIPERYALLTRCAEAENAYLQGNPCQVGYPGVKETLAALSQRYRLFIVSNSQTGYPELCMEKLGLTPYISGHLCYGDTLTSKGQTILTLMRSCGIENCAYIGDTQGDCDAAAEAGIPFIWAAYGFGTPRRFDARIDAVSELLNL